MAAAPCRRAAPSALPAAGTRKCEFGDSRSASAQRDDLRALFDGFFKPPWLAGSRLSQTPLGLDLRIGHEVDLLFAMREWRHAELTPLLRAFGPVVVKYVIEQRVNGRKREIGERSE